MKKMMQWVLAATLIISGLSVFTACGNDDDDPATPDLNISEKIIGKWMTAARDGSPSPTNRKRVFTFLSATKGYMSTSVDEYSEARLWGEQIETDIVINGNKVTLTSHPDAKTTGVDEFTISDINDKEFSAVQKVTVTVDGKVVLSQEFSLRFTKITADYKQAILGLWECTDLMGIETYNDANARLEFFADGTYKYWRKDDSGQWPTVTTREFQNYFVDGTLLATRWKNVGEDELREWWEIVNIANDQMQWKALRINADGSAVEQETKWGKVLLP